MPLWSVEEWRVRIACSYSALGVWRPIKLRGYGGRIKSRQFVSSYPDRRYLSSFVETCWQKLSSASFMFLLFLMVDLSDMISLSFLGGWAGKVVGSLKTNLLTVPLLKCVLLALSYFKGSLLHIGAIMSNTDHLINLDISQEQRIYHTESMLSVNVTTRSHLTFLCWQNLFSSVVMVVLVAMIDLRNILAFPCWGEWQTRVVVPRVTHLLIEVSLKCVMVTFSYFKLLLLLCWDIETNPGPVLDVPIKETEWTEMTVKYWRKLGINEARLLGGELGLTLFTVQDKNIDEIIVEWKKKADNVVEKYNGRDPHTWNVLHEALQAIGQSGIAKAVSDDKLRDINHDVKPVCSSGATAATIDFSSQKNATPVEAKFPYLDTSKLEEFEKTQLLERLTDETNAIRRKFRVLVNKVFLLLGNLSLDVGDIATKIVSLWSSPEDMPESHEHEILCASRVYKIEPLLRKYKYITFLDYEMLEAIIDTFELNRDARKSMEEYISEFEVFCKRSVFEVPLEAIDSPKIDEKLVIKVSDKYFGEKKQFSLEELCKVKRLLIKMLPKCRFMYVDCIEVGCIQVTFVLLTPNKVLPLSEIQLKRLNEIGLNVTQPCLQKQKNIHIGKDLKVIEPKKEQHIRLLKHQQHEKTVSSQEEDISSTSALSGAEDSATFTIERSNELQSLEWKDHGLQIHVLPDAINFEEASDVTITAATTSSENFVVPQDHVMVSPVYYLQPSVELNKPITLEIKHSDSSKRSDRHRAVEVETAEEDQRHYEAYQQALQSGVSVAIKYLKLLMLGPPRAGKTSLRRRLIGEIIHLLGQANQPSTGTVDAHNVVVKLTEEKMTSLAASISATTWRAVGHGAEKTDLDEELHLFYQFITEGSAGLTSTVSVEPQPSASQSIPDLGIHENIDSLADLPDMISKSKPSDSQEALVTNTTVTEEQSMMVSHDTEPDPDPELKEIERALEAFNTALKSRASHQQLKVLLEKTILLNMVDTGGQPAFMEMLPMLTIGPALYLIFLRLDQEFKQRYKIQYVSEDNEEVSLVESSYTFQEVVFQVLSSIACFSSDTSSATSVPDKPQITSQQSQATMLVGTYKDKLEGSPEEVQSKVKQIDRALQEELKKVLDTDLFEADRNLLRYASEDHLMFDVDNMTGGEDEVKKIRKRLEEVILQDFNEVPIPASWLMFGLFLRRMGKHQVSLSHCEEIGRRLHMNDVREAIWFLHHCIGVLMYYPDVEELKDVVICDPQIVFDSITELILNTFKFGPVKKAACDKFKQAGQFSFNDIEKLSKTLKSGILPLPQLVKLLEYLYIIARISYSEESGAASTEAPQLASVADVHDEIVYFMPAVLPSAGESELNVSHSPVDPAPLLIRFKSGIVPLGLFCASIASLVARKKLGWTLMEPQRSGSYTLYKNRVTFRVHIQGVSYDITLISKPKRYEVHITLVRSPSARQSHEICKHVMETVCQTLDHVISKMRHKQNLALSPSNSSTVSPYELGFQCPLHPDEDHMAVCRVQSGVMDSSLSTTHLLFEYSKNNSSLFCLKVNVVVDRAALTGTLNPSSNPGGSSRELKDSITPHVQGGRIDEKYSLWMGPSNVVDAELNLGLKEPQPQSNQPSSQSQSPVHELQKLSDKVVRHFKPATFSETDTSATAIWELGNIYEKLNGEGIIIAIVDNGINYNHKAFETARKEKRLAGLRSYPEKDKYTNEWNSPGGDKASHGTMAAFIAGGEAFGAVKSGGVAPKSTLVFFSVGNDYDELAIINALNKLIKWKVAMPPHPKAPDIISMSFGLVYTPDDPNQMIMRSQIKRLRELDVVIIAAAGNSGKMDGGVQFPACDPNVICVGTHGKEGYKQKTNAPEGIDVFAPGKHIPHPTANGSDTRDCSSGSSCAAPAIAGLMALLLQFSEKYVKDVEKKKTYRQDLVFLKKTLFGDKLRKGGDTVLLKPLNFFEKEIAKHEAEELKKEKEKWEKEKEQLLKENERLKRMQGHNEYSTDSLISSSNVVDCASSSVNSDSERSRPSEVIAERAESATQEAETTVQILLQTVEDTRNEAQTERQGRQQAEVQLKNLGMRETFTHVPRQIKSEETDRDLPTKIEMEQEVEKLEDIQLAYLLRGVVVCSETTLIVTSSSQHFHWKGYGLTLHFPDGCLPAGVEKCSITIMASLAGQYKFLEDSHLVSAVFWLRCESRCKFTKAISVEIEHCALKENTSKLSIVRSHCIQEKLPYAFKKLGGSFTDLSSYGCIEVDSFSGLAITQDGSKEREYCAGLYYLEKIRLNPEIHFVMHWNIEAHLTHVRRQYESKGAVAGPDIPVNFAAEDIYLDIPSVVSGGWKLVELTPLVITKKLMDSFEPGCRIPHCQIQAHPPSVTDDLIPVLTHQVLLHGAKQPYNSLTISFIPNCARTNLQVIIPDHNHIVRSRTKFYFIIYAIIVAIVSVVAFWIINNFVILS